MSIRTKNAATAALILVAATWASSASALVITGKFYLTESVKAAATEPGDTYVGHYTTVDFDNSTSMVGDVVALSELSVADLFGGFSFSFSNFMGTSRAVLGSPNTVVAFTGDAVLYSPDSMQIVGLQLRHDFDDPSDATFSAMLMDFQNVQNVQNVPNFPNFQMIQGHQSVPEPTIFALFGGGLLALGTVLTRRRKQG